MHSDCSPPLSLEPEKISEFISRCSAHITRRGKDMAGFYAEEAPPDAVIYEVYELECTGDIMLAVTELKAGKVGNEYYMTKGHFHGNPEAGEVYFGLKGRGLLLLQTKDGETKEMELTSGTVACIPPGWAHRSVNTGEDDFIFLAGYPKDAGHDYGTIERQGFNKRVLEIDGKATVVPK